MLVVAIAAAVDKGGRTSGGYEASVSSVSKRVSAASTECDSEWSTGSLVNVHSAAVEWVVWNED